MDCLESFFINVLKKQNLLTEEKKINDPNYNNTLQYCILSFNNS